MVDTLRVLYVDDEPGLLELCRAYLGKTGEFSVDTVNSGKDALIQLDKKQYDAIISDYQMPEMDGISLLKQVRTIPDDLPFILFTGRGREEVVIEAINNGADFYIQKGGDPKAQFAELIHKVRQAVSKKRADRKLKENEEKFRTVADYTYGWEYWEAPDLSILYMSPSCERISGYSTEDFYETRGLVDSIVDSRDKEIWQVHRDETKITETPLNVDFRIVRKDGGMRWINHTCHPVFDSESRPIGRRASNRDVTDQKRAEAELNRAYEEIAASEEELRAQFDAIKEYSAIIRVSEEKYRNIIENMQDVVYRTDQNGNLIMFSPYGVKLAGYNSEEEMIGLDVAKDTYKNPEERSRFLAVMAEKGFVENYPLTLKTKDGNSRFVTTSSHFYYDDQGKVLGVEGIIHDITERKQIEGSLKESEEKFRTIFENSPYPISINSIPDGKFIEVNTSFLQSSGYTEAEVLGKNPLDLGMLSLIDFGRLSSRFLLTGKIENVPMALKGKDGTWVHVQFSCIPVTINERPTIMTVTAEITNFKRVEEELVQKNEELVASEENFRKIFENNALGMTLALPDLRFMLVNPAFVSMLGYTEDELRKMSFKDVTHPDHLTEDIEGIRVLLEGLIPVYSTEKRYIRKDGSTLWGSLKVSVIRNHDGTLRYYLAQIEDITPRKQAEELVRESEDKFASVFNGSPVALTLVSATDGTFVNVNDSFVRSTGYTRDEVIGKTSETLGIFADKNAGLQLAKSLHECRMVEDMEIQCRLKNGEIRPCLFSSSIIMTCGKPHILSTVRDNLARKKAEDALKESEEKFREIFNSANDGMHLHEVDEHYVPGKYVDVNEVVCRMLQYTKEELLEKQPVDISIEYRNPPEEQIAQELRENGHAIFETGHIRKDGVVIPVEINAHIITIGGKKLVLSIARDITGRKNAELAFQAMVTSMVGTTGKNSLRKITENISSWLGAECVMVGEIQPDGQTVRVLSMLLDGKEVHDYSYTLKGTPCDNVAEKGFCLYPDNVISLFPESRDLVELKIRGYMGTPLRNSEGTIIGILCALFRHPVKPTHGMQEIVNIIAVKASAEIERMRMIAALRESEETLAQVMNGVPTLISYMDTELRFVLVNKAHLDWYGRTKEELIGTSLRDLLPGDAFLRALPYYRKVLSGQEVTFENPTKDKDGRERVLNVRLMPHIQDGQIVGFFAALEDITERKRAEEKLRESEEKYRSNIEQSLDGILVSDEQGNIAIWNKSMALITGIQPDEAIGRPIWKIMYRLVPDENKSPELLKIIQDTLNNIFELKIDWTGDSREQLIQCADGTRKDVQESSFVIKVGNTLKFGASIRDITERRRAEIAVRQANKKLNLLSGITRHDINNQLMVLQGYLAVLNTKYPDPSGKVYIPKITTAAERISSMIRFTKEYEQIGIHSPAWQDCRTLVDTTVKEVPLEQVVVKNDFPESSKIFADPLIVKVFYNLVDNAVRYGREITTIRFFVEQRDGDHIVICEDNGIGIPEDEKEKIFELGFGKNTGFGLALSREILDITGITIRETGEPGKGARFEMTVPKGMYR